MTEFLKDLPALLLTLSSASIFSSLHLSIIVGLHIGLIIQPDITLHFIQLYHFPHITFMDSCLIQKCKQYRI
jgi:hypothetical protein